MHMPRNLGLGRFTSKTPIVDQIQQTYAERLDQTAKAEFLGRFVAHHGRGFWDDDRYFGDLPIFAMDDFLYVRDEACPFVLKAAAEELQIDDNVDNKHGWEEIARLVGFSDEKVYFAATKLKDAYINLVKPLVDATIVSQQGSLVAAAKKANAPADIVEPVDDALDKSTTQIIEELDGVRERIPSHGIGEGASQEVADNQSGRVLSSVPSSDLHDLNAIVLSANAHLQQDVDQTQSEVANSDIPQVAMETIRAPTLPQEVPARSTLTEKASSPNVSARRQRGADSKMGKDESNAAINPTEAREADGTWRSLGSGKRKRTRGDDESATKRQKSGQEAVTGVGPGEDKLASCDGFDNEQQQSASPVDTFDDPMDIDT